MSSVDRPPPSTRAHRPLTELEYNGATGNPLAGGRPTAGFSAETEISRKDFGLEWNVALETGGVMVGDKIELALEIEAIQKAATKAA